MAEKIKKNPNIVSVQLSAEARANFEFLRKMRGQTTSAYLQEIIGKAIAEDIGKIRSIFGGENEL